MRENTTLHEKNIRLNIIKEDNSENETWIYHYLCSGFDATIRFYTEIAALSPMLEPLQPGLREIAFLGNAEGETMLEFIEMAVDNCVSAKGMTLCFESMDS